MKKKNGPSFPQVQVGTKGALLSYVVQVSCSAFATPAYVVLQKPSWGFF